MFWRPARRKIPRWIGGSVFGFLPKKCQRSQGPDSHLGLKGGGPESARLGCYALPSTFSSLYTAAEKKIILTPCFKTKIFIISHSFCGSGTGAQPSWVLPAQGLLCSYGESLLAGAGIGSR